MENEEKKELSAKDAFLLHQSYGFPIELTVEIAKEKGFTVDVEGFYKLVEEHKEASRKAGEKKFGKEIKSWKVKK
jgi:alanyl-tRNA synthetase